MSSLAHCELVYSTRRASPCCSGLQQSQRLNSRSSLIQSTHKNINRRHATWTPAGHRYTQHSQRKLAVSCVTDLPLIASEEDLETALSQNKVVVIDWMARWCRKCIYLKPKIQKMMEDDFPDIPIVYIDVNAVPGKVVYGNGIKKMPTIALYKDKQKVAEHIAAEGGKDAVAKIKEMLETNLQQTASSQAS